ncbi:hypothetical protein OCU04_010456 [Sclerotinia nivalis]|uniref:Malonyl-CoA:ACP transacylase (MAT) domain-containing protein n=1 Tax=Sclerotinia nivalis TaxID=352851 RepID=A0A9X0AEL8_9HELO|nr:hypothetical protein OCU04_010456 [Sclerotinia nivalis]
MAPDTASPVQSHGHLPMLTSTIPKLLLWSTADKLGMARMAKKYVEYFTRINKAMSNAEFEHFLDSLSYTLTERRTSLSWKSFAIIKSLPDLIDLPSRISEPVNTSRLTSRRLGFIFTGQGAQWAQMGQDLIVYPIFKHSLQESALVFQAVGASWSLFEELEKTKVESKVNEPGLSQSLCTALQIALVDLLSSFGVKPLIAIGHSSGEIAAA